MKERTLNVRDVDFEDFLVNDAEFALDRYARVLSAEIAMKERFGDVTLRPQIDAVRAEYGDLIANAKSEKTAGKLAKERDRVIDRIEAARDLMRGTYQLGERGRVPYRVLQSLMSYNFIRLLGDVVVSSLGDIARLSMTHGMRNVMEGAVVPLIRNLKQTRMTAIQAKEWAGISEVMLATRLMKIADITDPYSARTPLENTLSTMSGMAGKYSGILHWNDALKSMAVLSFTNRVRRLNGTKADERFLNRVGLSEDLAERARTQMQTHGEDGAGAFDPHIERWTDPEVRDQFVRAMRADADTTVVTPGIGDKVPVAEHHYWLKPALQFRSFTLAAHRKILIAGLQEDQTRFLMNAATMSAMGMMVYQAKALTSGRDTSDNPGVWIAEGIDRAGIIPLYMEISNMLEAVNGPGAFYLLGNLLGENPEMASRFASRNVGGALAGPTAGLLGDLKNIVQSTFIGITDDKTGVLSGVTEGTVGSAKRILPFGNHPAIRPYLNLYAVPSAKEALR
ncbi:MAG: hypothetical protein AAF340_17975 [Pseudomonadota bacterium]